MATHRRPKGVYTRPTQDFFLLNAGIASAIDYTVPSTGNYIFSQFTLFNNSGQGNKLYVQSVLTNNESNDIGAILYAWVTTPVGSQVNVAKNIDPTGAAPPGLVYLDSHQVSGAVAFGGTNPFMGAIQDTPGMVGFVGNSPVSTPVAIIPAGWGYMIGTQFAGGTGNNFTIFFTWLAQ